MLVRDADLSGKRFGLVFLGLGLVLGVSKLWCAAMAILTPWSLSAHAPFHTLAPHLLAASELISAAAFFAACAHVQPWRPPLPSSRGLYISMGLSLLLSLAWGGMVWPQLRHWWPHWVWFGLGNLGFILLSAYVVRTWIEARRDAEGLQAFKYKHKGA